MRNRSLTLLGTIGQVMFLLCSQVATVWAQTGDTPTPADAIPVTHTHGWTSNGTYSLMGKTAAAPLSSCSGQSLNLWFTFTASQELIRIQTHSNLNNHTELALWKLVNNQLESVSCVPAMTKDFELIEGSLDVGATYYFAFEGPETATFDISISTAMDNNNWPGNALEIPHQDQWYSGDYAYSVQGEGTYKGASPAGQLSGCGGLQYNRWFTFIATSSLIRVQMTSSSAHANLALFDSNYNQIHCKRRSDAEVSSEDLVPGARYYISYEGALNFAFGLRVLTTHDNNWWQGAIEIEHEDGWYSGESAYETGQATATGVSSSCGGAPENRWFKFVASGSFIRVQTNSSFQHTNLVLWSFDGSTWQELDCIRGNAVGSTFFEVYSEALNPGDTYYVSFEGPAIFDLRVLTTKDYNWPEGAVEVTHFDGWYSGDDVYTLHLATAEGPEASCRATNNRWFKFQALGESVGIKAGITANHVSMALFDGNFQELACIHSNDTGLEQFQLDYSSLTKGETYYFSVVNGDIPFDIRISGGATSPWILTGNTVHPIDLNFQVGVGTDAVPPQFHFAVDGHVLAEEIKVQQSQNWPDYVFDPSYDLRSLEEVQQYIQANHHLPEVPSAAEVQSEGLMVGEMNAVLLKKIEELTLYILQQQKEIDDLKKLVKHN